MRTTKLPQNSQHIRNDLPQKGIEIREAVAKNNSNPNQPNWSYIIRNQLYQGNPKQVLSLYTQIRRKGLYILGLVPLIFKACVSASTQTYGKSLHAESIKSGVAIDLHISSSLPNMYSKCGNLVDSLKVFDEMPERNVVTRNAMIVGYLKNGDRESALDLFENICQSE
ncbi:hypothetical protein PTKIN_Ptkin16aG0039100 [Pterospermum kingtungense]